MLTQVVVPSHPPTEAIDLTAELQKRLSRALAKTQRALAAVQGDIAKVEAAPQLLYETELLKTVHPKAFDKDVRVMDYATDPPSERIIALQPGMPFKTQLERRFRQARRLMDSEGKVLERLQVLQLEWTTLCALQARLDAGETAAVAAILIPPARVAKHKEGRKPELPYREYLSRAGVPIWVGKSGTANDRLTFKTASPHASWFHASGFAGAHVVVQKRRGQVLDTVTRDDAALLAAHFSKAPEGDWVEVAMTDVKFVRKFKGAKTGQVLISRETHLRFKNEVERVKPLL